MRCHTFAWSCYDKYYFGISHDRLKDPVENHIAWQQPGAEPKNLTLVAMEPEQVPVLQDISSAGRVSELGFADHLYSTEDYQRAAMEYLRAGFADTSRAVRTYAGLMAGESFLRAKDYARARTAFQETGTPAVIDICQYGIARTWFAQGHYDRTRAVLDSITGSGLAHERLVLTGWTLFKEHRFPEAASLFRCAAKGDTLALRRVSPLLPELAELDGRSLPRRNRTASTLLSAVIPGAGHLYSGRAGDGVYAFLTVAGSGLLTYWFAANPEKDRTRIKLSIFTTLTALFHAANIYGANIAARDYNRFQERKYLTQAERILHSARLEPDYRAVIENTAPPDTTGYNRVTPLRCAGCRP